MNENLMKLI